MKRFMLGLIAVALISITSVNFAAAAAVNDFIISDFQVDYYLDKDTSGHSTLNTVESITAQFPDFDQNHGIERALVSVYDGHTTDLKVQSVTDQNSKSLTYSTSWQGDNLVLRIGDKDVFVHGSQTYIIKYSQRDVTRFFTDTNDDEFYWNTNGNGWYQQFDKLTARLHVGAGITDSLNGNMSCYFGAAGSTNKCTIARQVAVITASTVKLNANENMTIAVGFKPKTFTQYSMTVGDFIQRYITFISVSIGLIGIIIIAILRLIKGKSAPGRGIIIAEYLPPHDVDVALSSVIRRKSTTWTAATYIDLAVRHKLKVIEREKDLYSLEFTSSDGLTDTENAVVKALFGENPKAGDRYDIDKDKTNPTLAYKLMGIYRKVKQTAKAQGYYIIDKKLRTVMGILILVTTVQSFVFWMFSSASMSLLADFLPYIGITFAVIGTLIAFVTKPLSIKGRELFDYLKGLELYIKTAEEDRIKMLQSPQGADKTPVNTNDTEKLLHLYERVLPYAVLFGNEKEWSKTLGKYYEQQNTTPDWYVSNGVFNAVVFSSAFSSFSGNVYNNSSIQSSSGGSGGGGFSGGGGGGGGGGGW